MVVQRVWIRAHPLIELLESPCATCPAPGCYGHVSEDGVKPPDGAGFVVDRAAPIIQDLRDNWLVAILPNDPLLRVIGHSSEHVVHTISFRLSKAQCHHDHP